MYIYLKCPEPAATESPGTAAGPGLRVVRTLGGPVLQVLGTFRVYLKGNSNHDRKANSKRGVPWLAAPA